VSKWYKILALVIASVAVIVLAYAVLTPEEDAESTDHGMWGRTAYTTQDVGVIAISLIAVVASIAVVMLWKTYEPLPPSMAPSREQSSSGVQNTFVEPVAVQVPAEIESPDEVAARNYLVLRLLSGDERTMYKALMDSSGEALQKDLILRTKMSNAKVSRVLDRLVEKDVVLKERHGATNKIRIKLDR